MDPVVITGDITQIDLPKRRLFRAAGSQESLENVKGIAIVG